MKTTKTLVINPPDTDKDLTIIVYEQVMNDLFAKVFGTTPDAFKPMLFGDKQCRLFLANVESRTVAVSKYANKQLNTSDEASAYLNEIGTAVYGAHWKTKLISNEVMLSKGSSRYGLLVPSEEFIQAIRKELAGLAEVIVHMPELKKSKKSKPQATKQDTNQNESEN